MNTPWRVSETANSRVCIVGADGHVMTEVLPGQVQGRVVTQEDRIAIARYIVDCVKYFEGDYR